ncbi:ABC-F family ATP-binding cassette domain-containing protein [Mycobacterium simiae]|uniref:ABC-F family ATP-binding cassette domain-containing protein n=1 Tax=Mycobacterium simiae TaxID=1784 RepID=A0A5B1BRN1_MYCSI|nr:ABC-F family ATP-binding cassette domain-containing protein [Mycobacterium simiae]KAA1250003.1 ABC-F family ATP-binding cassette domain-containing protein [Mycobacterium simiae]
MPDASVVCSNLSFSWPDGTSVLEGLSFVFETGRTGLVASNGAGKTTLLQLIAKHYRPGAGSVSVHGVLGYLPQHLSYTADLTVAQVLGVAPVLAALSALGDGDADEEIFATIGADWDIADRVTVELNRLGLGHIELDRRLDSVSGGEAVSLGLAAQLLKRPDVLVLDEPTNNLDLGSRRRLYTVLDDFPGCVVVASHDRMLLERMDRIAELNINEIRCYVGNYTCYEDAMRRAQVVAEQNLRNAAADLKRQQRDRQKARERAARRTGTAVRNRQNLGLPKALLDKRKSAAQESAGKSDQNHAARVQIASARVDQARGALRQPPVVSIDLPETHVPAGRTVFFGEDLQVRLNSQPLFAGEGLELAIRGPERIALIGANGAGKSTLLGVISGRIPCEGTRFTRVPVAYLNQRLNVLNAELTIADNLAAFAPTMPVAQRRARLARYLFPGARADRPVATLSGGERLRAALVCLLSAEPPPQLLLLDEPTNNLDLHSVAQLRSALAAYQGASVVVSHDQRFLRDLKPDRWLQLSEGRLREIGAPD